MTAHWDFSVGYWNTIVAIVVTGLHIVLAAGCVRKARNPRRSAVIEGIRALGTAVLIASLFKPELVRPLRKADRPLVAVLSDASDSMQTRDVPSASGAEPVRRNEWLAAQREARFWEPIEEKHEVAVHDFSASPAPVSNAPPSDPGTDINGALLDALAAHPGLRAVLLLSDGDWNMGKAPAAAATRLRLRDIPVFTVAVGSDRYLPDLELSHVLAPVYGLVDEHISIHFTVRSRLPRDVRTTLSLMDKDGETAAKEVLIPAMSEIRDSLAFEPQGPGEFDFKLLLPVEKDEEFGDNNSRSFHISVRRELLKVLVVESLPRWEYRYLRNALSRDPGVDVDCLLLHPGMGSARGRDYVPSFPDSRQTLSEYDVVFLGDVGIGEGELTLEQADLLKGLVEQQGSGLVFMPGLRGRHATLVGSPLDDLMPVTLDNSQPAGFGLRLPSQLALTTRGKGHLLTMLANSPAANDRVWRRLSGFYWHAPVLRAKAGGEVLAVHATARNRHGRLPLLVTRACGNGKTLFMGTDGAWRWRRGVEDVYHYRFWGQVIRWMAHQRHLAYRGGVRFFFRPESPRAGESVLLHVTVYDRSGYPLESGTVTATIVSPTGQREELTLAPEEGGWGVFTASFMPEEGGRHRLRIECPEAERRLDADIPVHRPTRERAGRPARSTVLQEIAAITAGRHGTTRDLEAIVQSLRLLPEPSAREWRLRLWCHPLWAALIVSVLAVYWVLRKLNGMV